MGMFSGKKEKKQDSAQFKAEKIPRVLPDTLMQKISVSKNQDLSMPKKPFADESKIMNQVKEAKDEHKRIPEYFISQQPKEKGPEKQEVEKVIMIKKDFDDAAKDLKESDLPSFFHELEKRLFEKGIDRKHIVSQDIMSRLKEYHESMDNGQPFFLHELEIESEIAKSLESLKNIESEWIMTKRNVAVAEKLLSEKESEMQSKLTSFKNLLITAEKFRAFNVVAEEDKAFVLYDGTKIKSIQALMVAISGMKDAVFYSHVNADKNDFANWIRHVFGLDELATRVSFAKTKQELLEVLRNY